jgi:hypothetical protein
VVNRGLYSERKKMKLKTEAKTNVYELTYLVSTGFTEGELKKVQDEVQALVKNSKEKLSPKQHGERNLLLILFVSLERLLMKLISLILE